MTVLITGAARGIGRYIADRLYDNGHEVIGISKTSPLDSRWEPTRFTVYQADVKDFDSLMSVYDKIKQKTISGLINSAGVFDNFPFSIFNQKDYKNVIETNLIGTINTCSIFLNLMNKNVHTPIINISSLAAHINNNLTAYTASKSGLEGFTSSLAKELYKTKIRPNCIAPGLIHTDMTFHIEKFFGEGVLNTQPLGIRLESSHVADIVELLFDPKSNCIGGQAIQIG